MLRFLSTMLLVSALALLTACGGSGTGSSGDTTGASGGDSAPRLAFVTNGVDPFWVIAQKGVEAAATATGADAEVLMPAGGVVDQKRMLEDLLSKGVDGIALSPIDPENQTDLINMCASRTTVITHDSDAPDSDRLVFIGVDNYAAGRMCGQLVKEALPDGGKVFVFIGRLEQDNARLRRQGVIDELLDRSHDPTRYDEVGGDALVGDRFTILGTLTDQFDRAKAKANAEDAMARHPDIDGMIGLFAYNPPACLAALEQAGRLGDVKIVGFDEQDATLQGIVDGTVHGTCVQDPYNYGYRSIEVLAALHRGDDSVIPATGVIDVPARQIRADNVQAFWADLRKKTGR